MVHLVITADILGMSMSGTTVGGDQRYGVRRMPRSGLGRQLDMEGELGLEEIGRSSEVANVIPSSTQVSFEACSGLHAFGCIPTLVIKIKCFVAVI